MKVVTITFELDGNSYKFFTHLNSFIKLLSENEIFTKEIFDAVNGYRFTIKDRVIAQLKIEQPKIEVTSDNCNIILESLRDKIEIVNK